MKVFECPQRDMELRTNDDESLPDHTRFCPTHYVPLVERKHPTGQCRETYSGEFGKSEVYHCAHEEGAKAYEKAGA